jgi:hypothetical protein
MWQQPSSQDHPKIELKGKSWNIHDNSPLHDGKKNNRLFNKKSFREYHSNTVMKDFSKKLIVSTPGEHQNSW